MKMPSLTYLAGITALVALNLNAQTYTLVDLTPDSVYSTATAISTAGVAGSKGNVLFGATHAALWDGANQIDLHPSFVDGTGTGGSSVQGAADSLQVGWASGPGTANRSTPVSWNSTADSVKTLTIPFVNNGGRALATDGKQIVGYGQAMNRDGTAFGPFRAILWDANTGTATDLGDGGTGAQAVAVGGGKQVGYVVKRLANAAVWSSTAKSLTVLHPTGAVISTAYGTDGARQVGYAGYDVRVRAEAAKGNKDARFNYAMVWTGTAASAINIHPYPFTHSCAMAVNGDWIAGYANDNSKIGTPAYNHAVVWNANYEATDLNAYLPEGFIGAQAFAVDANGNVAGYMAKADGSRHAVVWMLNPAQ